jgi:hypothetical protein
VKEIEMKLIKNIFVYFVFFGLFFVLYLLVYSLAIAQLSVTSTGKELNIESILMPMVVLKGTIFCWHTWFVSGVLSTVTVLVYLDWQSFSKPEAEVEKSSKQAHPKRHQLRRLYRKYQRKLLTN